MKILFDLSSVRVGGGVEQSLSVLAELMQIATRAGIETTCLVCRDTPVHRFIVEHDYKHIVIPTRFFSRVYFNLVGSRQFLSAYKPNCVYTFFGIGLPRDGFSKRIINVAYPIICYPDSAYWSLLPARKRMTNRLKARLRSALIRHRSDLILAETTIMRERLVSFSGFDGRTVKVMPPVKGSVASLLEQGRVLAVQEERAANDREDAFKIIFVSGSDPHKNLWRLVAAARLAMRNGGFTRRVKFQVTITRAAFLALCHDMGVDWSESGLEDYFEFLGSQHGPDLARVVTEADVFANISDLESISNNFIEAAAADKPMLIAERDFSLYACRMPYVVAEPHDPKSLVDAIERAIGGEYTVPPESQQDLTLLANQRAQLVMDEITKLCE